MKRDLRSISANLIHVFLIIMILYPVNVPAYSVFASSKNQVSGIDVQKYLYPGEIALPMTSVYYGGQDYSLYMVTNDNAKTKSNESIFYDTQKNDWDSDSISAILAFSNQGKYIVDENLLRNLFLTQLGGYIGTQDYYYYQFVPADSQIIQDMTEKSTDPLFIAAFSMQEAVSVLKFETDVDKYAEVLRLLLAEKDPNVSDFARDVSEYVGAEISTWESAIDNVIKMEKYANDKNVRETAKIARNYFDDWENLSTPSVLQAKIGPYEVNFANWLDLGNLAINLIFLQQISPTRISIFTDLVNEFKLNHISLSPDLIAAIGLISAEANDPTLQRVDIVFDFVRDHSAEIIVDLTEDVFRKIVTNYIWQKAGTQITGHLLAGAFSSVFLAFSLADILFNMNSIYGSMITAETAAKITAQMNENLGLLKAPNLATFQVYPFTSNTFRKVVIAWNLSMAQSYASYASAIDSSRLLVKIADFSGMKWSEAVTDFQKYSTDGFTKTENILINPKIIEYAITLPIKRLSQTILPGSLTSSTVLVFDTSGSMGEYDTSGQAKIEAAKKAGEQILNMVSAENSAQNTANQIAIAGYSTQAYVVSPLTSDISALFSSIETLTPTNRTAMADGLKAGLDLYGSNQNKKILILLSDGLPNVALNTTDLQDIAVIKQQVLDLATQAGQNGICVYTVGFGDPSAGMGSIDEGFLTEVANASGCGMYYNALDAISLANVYVELRHASTGSVIYKQSGQISQGQNLDLGQVEVPANQELMLLTLNWPGSRLEAVLKDPTGTIVNTSYTGASISETSTLLSIILENPVEGSWSLGVNGVDVPEGTTVYNTIISTRAGAVVTPEVKGGSFPIIFLVLILAGSAMGVFVYSNSIKRAGKGSTVKPSKGGSLVGSDGEFTNHSIPLRDGLIIGRGSGASLRINDPSVSRAHARIRYAQGSWFIQDLDSKGGVFINGNKVNASRLSNGDKLQIGSQSFTFIDGKK